MNKQIKIRASLSRNYGPITLTLDAEELLTLDDEATARDIRRQTFEALTMALADQHMHFATEQLRALADLIPDPAQRSGGDDTRLVEADVLSVELRDGKKRCRVKGGIYSKYGVTVWPEVLEKLDLPPEAREPGEHELDPGLSMVVQMNGDKPKKVVGWKSASEIS
jgi:hypothetical protein